MRCLLETCHLVTKLSSAHMINRLERCSGCDDKTKHGPMSSNATVYSYGFWDFTNPYFI